MKKTVKKGYRLAAGLAFGAALLAVVIYGFSWVLMPTRTNYGCMWTQYRSEPEDTVDALFFGSSMVYCDVIPSVIWEETGLRTYVMAGPEQTMPVTYYYVRESCRTQNPQAVVVEVNGLFFPEYTNYTKANIGYMPWGQNRLLATLHGAEAKEVAGLLMPIFNYHDLLWGALDNGALQAYYDKKMNLTTDPLAGFTLMEKIEPQSEMTVRKYSTDNDAYRKALDYLEKIAQFCREQEIQLVLYAAPAYGRIPEDVYAAMQRDLETIPHAAFFDGNELNFEQYDPERDWCDFLHTNATGAVKFSREMARQLSALNLNVTEQERDLWQSRVEALTAQMEKLG